jgi:hypothetical protein
MSRVARGNSGEYKESATKAQHEAGLSSKISNTKRISTPWVAGSNPAGIANENSKTPIK